jgi:hypothetical protein
VAEEARCDVGDAGSEGVRDVGERGVELTEHGDTVRPRGQAEARRVGGAVAGVVDRPDDDSGVRRERHLQLLEGPGDGVPDRTDDMARLPRVAVRAQHVVAAHGERHEVGKLARGAQPGQLHVEDGPGRGAVGREHPQPRVGPHRGEGRDRASPGKSSSAFRNNRLAPPRPGPPA